MIDITRSETHDRLLKFKQQSDYISKGIEDCMKNRPVQFTMPFYVYAHTRTVGLDEKLQIYRDDFAESLRNISYQQQYKTLEDVPSKRLLWAPRLTKPLPETNSMLFKVYPGTDLVKIIWIIPSEELWGNYSKGKMMSDNVIEESIRMFRSDPRKLAEKEEDDLSDKRINEIYDDIRKVYGSQKYQMI